MASPRIIVHAWINQQQRNVSEMGDLFGVLLLLRVLNVFFLRGFGEGSAITVALDKFHVIK